MIFSKFINSNVVSYLDIEDQLRLRSVNKKASKYEINWFKSVKLDEKKQKHIFEKICRNGGIYAFNKIIEANWSVSLSAKHTEIAVRYANFPIVKKMMIASIPFPVSCMKIAMGKMNEKMIQRLLDYGLCVQPNYLTFLISWMSKMKGMRKFVYFLIEKNAKLMPGAVGALFYLKWFECVELALKKGTIFNKEMLSGNRMLRTLMSRLIAKNVPVPLWHDTIKKSVLNKLSGKKRRRFSRDMTCRYSPRIKSN